jgi:hypothetical protein
LDVSVVLWPNQSWTAPSVEKRKLVYRVPAGDTDRHATDVIRAAFWKPAAKRAT